MFFELFVIEYSSQSALGADVGAGFNKYIGINTISIKFIIGDGIGTSGNFMEYVKAESIIISDYDCDDDEKDKYYGKITLGISNDQYVHYDRSPFITQLSLPENKFSLQFEGYSGTILLPKHAGIDILTDRLVEGIVASPIVITGAGNIDITIDKKSGIELCLETQSDFVLNNKLRSACKDIHGWYMYGKDFQSFVNKSRKHQEYVINKKPALDKYIASEYPKEPELAYIDVCLRYNLAYISKRKGIIGIEYSKPEIKAYEPYGIFRDNIKLLNRALNKAIEDERYENASEILKKIQTMERCIEKNLAQSSFKNIKQQAVHR